MKQAFLRITALLLLAVMLALPLASCANRGTPMLSLTVDGKTYTFSVNLYELMLSAMKGTLAAYGYTSEGHKPTEDAYWDIMDTHDGKTMESADEYCRKNVLDNCKTYLIAMYLFDKYELELSESAKKKIEDDLAELIKTDGEGSKTKLNSILSAYGVNYDMMEEYFVMKAKLTAVQDHIYSTLGPNIKQTYMEENYVHFYQIFLANYTYEYEKDKNEDVIYYDPTDNSICYKKTEFTQTDASGKVETDKKGKIIYYTDVTRTHISYDTEKGQPSYKVAENGESYVTNPMTEKELERLTERANDLYLSLKNATATQFKAAIEENSDDANASAAYTDGYYLQKGMDYSASGEDYMYLETIVEKLEASDVGAVTMIPSTSGYHIVMKFAHTDKAYEKEENEVWFKSFASGLTAQIFADRCEPYYDLITMDESVYQKAPNMKQVSVNYFYY